MDSHRANKAHRAQEAKRAQETSRACATFIAIATLVACFNPWVPSLAAQQNDGPSHSTDSALHSPDSPVHPPTEHAELSAFLMSMVRKVALVRAEDSAVASKPLLVPYRTEILSAAARYGLPPALIAGVIQQESVWDIWAERAEPRYLHNKTVIHQAKLWASDHQGLPSYQTELQDRARSMGLMQPLGQLAREQGFSERYLSALFIPANSIDQGSRRLKALLRKYKADTLAAISAYNAGTAHRRAGVFENARYVASVCIAWQTWRQYFKQTNEPVSKTRSSLHRRVRRRAGDGVGALQATARPEPSRDDDALTNRTHTDRQHDSAASASNVANRPRGESESSISVNQSNKQRSGPWQPDARQPDARQADARQADARRLDDGVIARPSLARGSSAPWQLVAGLCFAALVVLGLLDLASTIRLHRRRTGHRLDLLCRGGRLVSRPDSSGHQTRRHRD